LIAEGNDSRALTASFTVQVDPAPPRFSMLAISAKEIVRGERWATCYSVENAHAVKLLPNNMSLPTGTKRCFMLFPAQTTEFRLVATGERNMTAEEKISVKVQGR
jgi:hypothetical protein